MLSTPIPQMPKYSDTAYQISKVCQFALLYDDKDDMNIASLMNQVMDSNPVHMRRHGVQKNSGRIWLEIRANRLPGEHNEPDSCVISLHKIDYAKNKQLKLEKNRAFAETILDATADAIISVDTNGKIIQCNNTSVCM